MCVKEPSGNGKGRRPRQRRPRLPTSPWWRGKTNDAHDMWASTDALTGKSDRFRSEVACLMPRLGGDSSRRRLKYGSGIVDISVADVECSFRPAKERHDDFQPAAASTSRPFRSNPGRPARSAQWGRYAPTHCSPIASPALRIWRQQAGLRPSLRAKASLSCALISRVWKGGNHPICQATAEVERISMVIFRSQPNFSL